MQILTNIQKNLAKIVLFNRIFAAAIFLILLVYFVQLNSEVNIISIVLLIFAALLLLFHVLIIELIGQILPKKDILTTDICKWFAKVAAISFSVVVTTSCLFTGNLYIASFYAIAIIIGSFLGDFGVKRIGAFAAIFVILFQHTGLAANEIFINNVVSYVPSSLIQAMSIGCIVILAGVILSSAKQSSQKTNILQSMATTDVLTGLLNRRYFDRRIIEEIARANRHKSNLSLALFDIDHFKQINDTYGHTVGDKILKELGEIILINTRESDIAARYGGEEFALILPETTQIEASELLERLRQLVENHTFFKDDIPIAVTISVGIAQCHPDYSTEDFIEQSDSALYRAKGTGRNRVVYGTFTTPKLNFQKITN